MNRYSNKAILKQSISFNIFSVELTSTAFAITKFSLDLNFSYLKFKYTVDNWRNYISFECAQDVFLFGYIKKNRSY